LTGARVYWIVVLAGGLAAASCHKRPPPSAIERSAPEPPPAAPATEPSPPAPASPPPAQQAEPAAEVSRLRDAIARARDLLGTLAGRPLAAQQRLNVQSAGSFAEQAEAALDEGDLERASVLSDKALTLLEAALDESSSDPE
jgi:hypothetical protein